VLQFHVVLLRNLDEGAPLERFTETWAESTERAWCKLLLHYSKSGQGNYWV